MDDAEDSLVFCHEFLTDHIMMDEMTIFLFGSIKTVSVEKNAIAQMVVTTEDGNGESD